MKHIFFPTDFSANSLRAFPYALDMAYLFGAQLTIFNSYSLPYSKSNVLVSMQEKLQKDSLDELQKLKEQAISQSKYSHLDINIESRYGSFVSLISKLAEEMAVDIIVMGTKGASGLKEMFIGSNTLEVIHVSHCPVLVIPEKAENTKVNHIAMATDLKEVKNNDQLIPLFKMARICKAAIEFVHILKSDDDISLDEKVKQVSVLEEMSGDIKTSIHFATNDDIIEGLSTYISERKPEMIGMLSRKHSLFERIFLKSITNKLSFRTEIPLLVIDE